MNEIIDYEERLIWWTKWISTALAVGCAAMSAMDIYPLNVWFGWLAGFGWTWVAWKWNEWSLITINILMTVIYGFGVARHLFG
jgi:hypothetical protein